MLSLFLGGCCVYVGVFCSISLPLSILHFFRFSLSLFPPNSAYAINLFITVVGGFSFHEVNKEKKNKEMTCHVPFLHQNK